MKRNPNQKGLFDPPEPEPARATSIKSGRVNPDADVCAAKHGGNKYSVEAHNRTDSAKGRLGIARRIKESGRDWNAYEYETWIGNGRSSVSSRFGELKYMNVLVSTGKWRPTGTGTPAEVFRYRNDSDPPAKPWNPDDYKKWRAFEKLKGKNDDE